MRTEIYFKSPEPLRLKPHACMRTKISFSNGLALIKNEKNPKKKNRNRQP